MSFLLIALLCVASAILGRLLLTTDEARATITVRLPALFELIVLGICASVFWIMYGVLCFLAGSFYGLHKWWWPQLFEVLEFDGNLLGAVISGKWNPQ
jgi:hypothetical protein